MNDSPEAFTLRPATPADETFLRSLFFHVHMPEFAPLGLPAPVLDQLLGMQFRARQTSYANDYPTAIGHIVEVKDEPAGRLLVDSTPGSLHLVDIALLAGVRGRGIGGELLARLSRQADRHGLTLRLHVRLGNPALRLYQRHGFVNRGGDGLDLACERPPAPF